MRRPVVPMALAMAAALLLVHTLLLVRTLHAAGPAPSPVVNDGYGDYVYVPAGAFRMGDNFGDGESRERPVHVVEARYWLPIGTVEVWQKAQKEDLEAVLRPRG